MVGHRDRKAGEGLQAPCLSQPAFCGAGGKWGGCTRPSTNVVSPTTAGPGSPGN